jgi:hypothetical protein
MARMNVEFTPETAQRLEGLAERLGTTKVGALRFGLALLGVAVREAEQGNDIGVIRGDRVLREISGVWSEAQEAVTA